MLGAWSAVHLEIILTIATILGGFAAIFYFWEKIAHLFGRDKQSKLQSPRENDGSKVPDIKLDEAVSFYDTMRVIAKNSPCEAILHSWKSTEAAVLEFSRKAGLEVGDNPSTAGVIDTLSSSGLIDKEIERWLRNLFGVRNESINAPMRYNYDDAMEFVDLAAKAIVALKGKIRT